MNAAIIDKGFEQETDKFIVSIFRCVTHRRSLKKPGLNINNYYKSMEKLLPLSASERQEGRKGLLESFNVSKFQGQEEKKVVVQ